MNFGWPIHVWSSNKAEVMAMLLGHREHIWLVSLEAILEGNLCANRWTSALDKYQWCLADLLEDHEILIS